jgi:hypothetical protein
MRLDGFFITIDNSSTISKIALGAILGMALSAVIAVALRMFGSKNDGQPPSSHSSAPPLNNLNLYPKEKSFSGVGLNNFYVMMKSLAQKFATNCRNGYLAFKL